MKHTLNSKVTSENVSHSVMSDALWPHGLQPTRLLCPWDSLGKNIGVGCHSLLQGIFLTLGSNQVSCIAGRFFTVWASNLASNKGCWPSFYYCHIFSSIIIHSMMGDSEKMSDELDFYFVLCGEDHGTGTEKQKLHQCMFKAFHTY